MCEICPCYTFFKFIIINFHQSFFLKAMNNFLDIPKTDMAQLDNIPVSNSYGWGVGGAGSSDTVIIR